MKPLLHAVTAAQLEAARSASGGYLFHGPRGMGKALAARELARRLNCLGDEAGLCGPCRLIESGTYPDYLVLAPTDKPTIGIDQVRGLVGAAALRPYHAASTRLIVIDEAEALTLEAQNALLKLIEEPPPATRVVLVATEPERLLATVRSRLSSIYFAPIGAVRLATWLEQTHDQTPARAAQIARAADGVPGVAVGLLEASERLEAHNELDELAAAVLTMSRFERLRLARRLVDIKADVQILATRLQRLLLQQISTGAATASEVVYRLAALEQFRRQLAANVSTKVAVERLMLEL